jgi:long-chain acyl-CoA synthetase
MNFLDDIFGRLAAMDDLVLGELREGKVTRVTGRELLRRTAQARDFISSKKLQRGERVALLAHNSIDWVATDLAIMAEGLIVVPLYARQAPSELVAIMKDCSPALICCGDAGLRDGITQIWPDAPQHALLEEVFGVAAKAPSHPNPAKSAPLNMGHREEPFAPANSDPVTIIYTSGTSGEAKGVVLTAGNIGHMLGRTSDRLDTLMDKRGGQDQVFHYLPFCFAGSWIMLLTCLLRGSRLTLNTDLTRLAGDMRTAAPDYFLNVPQLLERMRKAVDEQLWKTGGIACSLYSRAKGAWVRKQEQKTSFADAMWLRLANALVFPAIRKKMIGANLKALICGSAPLAIDTQLFFLMLGIPVLQVYGLTETTAICTMDDPKQVQPGWVGPAISGIEMKLSQSEEIVVRGPNIFSEYWNRPAETGNVLRDGWFHTGDQGEMNDAGNWRIIGRIKNLIILGSGHNVAPEPVEDEIARHLPGAQQVLLVGNGRGYLSVIVTGAVTEDHVQAAIDAVNSGLPHYKQIRAFHIHAEPFSIDNGLLTANGKLKRDLIAAQLSNEIEEMYQVKQAV